MPRIAVIIAAAGKGERFGNDRKTLAKLEGRPVFIRTIELFVSRDDVCQTILVVSGTDLDEIKSKYAANLSFMGVQLVEGGEQRADSVAAGLRAVKEEADLVAVHDAVRPCATSDMIDAVFAEAAKTGAAILAAPLVGTIKRVSDSGVIDATVSRDNLYEAQTPQVFRRDVIVHAYERRPTTGEVPTDDARLVELIGHPVTIVKSDGTNLKITTRGDMTLASAVIKSRPVKTAKAFGAFEEAQW